MKQRLIDFLMVLACITIILLALWFMPCIGSAEQETEPAETELAALPCPDVVLMVAPEPTPTSEATLPPEVDKPAYNPAIPLAEDLQYILWAACEENNVEPAIALGLIEVESGFDPDADNGTCYGLLPLNRRYFPSNLPAGENIRYGLEYLGQLLTRYSTVEAALTAYNAGHDTGSRVYANAVLAAAER